MLIVLLITSFFHQVVHSTKGGTKFREKLLVYVYF
jgi:hypothetical protein